MFIEKKEHYKYMGLVEAHLILQYAQCASFKHGHELWKFKTTRSSCNGKTYYLNSKRACTFLYKNKKPSFADFVRTKLREPISFKVEFCNPEHKRISGIIWKRCESKFRPCLCKIQGCILQPSENYFINTI